MSSAIDKLKSIGVQKIHEDTHISRGHLESIFQENFEEMNNSVQVVGFLSILEREYGVDLSELKLKSKEHFEFFSKYTKPEIAATNIFLADNKKRKLTFLYIILGVVLFVLFAYLSTNVAQEELAVENEISKVESVVQESNESLVASEENLINIDENSSALEQNNTQVEEIEEVIQTKTQEITDEKKEEAVKETVQEKTPLQSEAKGASLKITPKSKLWIGYIDLSTGKKSQTVSLDELSLDSTKDWLLTFGHGHLDIEANGKLQQYKTTKNLRFIYKSGELKELNLDEFKELNSGKIW